MKIILTASLLIGSISSTQASLIDRGGGLIYDDVLDVTWLQDAQYYLTTEGVLRANWLEATQWADQLAYYDSVRDTVWTDWRLPSTINDPSSIGWDTTGQSSELAYMYYINLGYDANMSLDPADPVPVSDNYNPFINLAYRGYWSGTTQENPDRPYNVWYLHFHFGYQDINGGLADEMRVWAVRDGDVAASVVPLPPAMMLMASGIIGLLSVGRLKRSDTA